MLTLMREHKKKKTHAQTLDNIICGHFREYSRETMELAFNQQQQVMFHQQQYYRSISSPSNGGSGSSSSSQSPMSPESIGDYSFSILHTMGASNKGPINNNVIVRY